MQTAEMTIGRLAKAAGVNIETIRYYQRLHLLPTPSPKRTAFRTYPVRLVDRIRFIKRAQELGFSLVEIASLLKLEDGTHRNAIRKVAGDRRHEIRLKLADLKHMERLLAHLIDDCETMGEAHPCPIITALAGGTSDVKCHGHHKTAERR
ncbi:MAG: MerR family DNA-binding protein [Gammaproteobacteria bacterium]|nr:MerR family DNA-binding protein [Gammaproteobacteria bacterium]